MTATDGPAIDAADPACRMLGIRVDDVADGRATARMRVTEQMTNQHGTAHGGFLFLLADAAFAYACNSHGPVTVARAADVTFLRPAAVGDDLVAEAAERTRFGPNGIYDVTVRREGSKGGGEGGGEIVAEFRGHSVSLPRRPQRTT